MYFKKNNTAIAGRLPRIDIYQFVFLTSEADLLGVAERMHALARIDTLYQVYLAVVFGRAHEIGAGLVERHGVQRSKDADIAHTGILGRGVAVAVYGQVVRHADIEDVVTAVVGDGLRRLGPSVRL